MYGRWWPRRFHGFADWLMFGGKLIGHNDPGYHAKIIKFNELLANCVIHSTVCDITDAANAIAAHCATRCSSWTPFTA